VSASIAISISPDEVRCCARCSAIYRKDFERCANDGDELVLLDHDPLIGMPIASYVIDELIGEGAMARVYRAHHNQLVHKQYALKIMLGDLSATQSMRLRFAKEAESASQLSHPNVVSVIDFGRTDAGLMYIAMELVNGRTLTDLYEGGPLEPERVVRIARQLAEGLGHAHGIGLIHRDFKPDNILVVDGPTGDIPRIADFGLAISNQDHADARFTEAGFVMGTAAYIAPEQCTDKPFDHRADLYALGVTIFELLTGGVLPFGGTSSEMLGRKIATAAPTIEQRVPELVVPPQLSAIVNRLLARRAEDRYYDAQAVIEALDATMLVADAPRRAPRADDTVQADPPTDAIRTPKRSRSPILLSVIGVLVVVLVALAWKLLASSSDPPAANIAKSSRTATAKPEPTPAQTPPVAKPEPSVVAKAEPEPAIEMGVDVASTPARPRTTKRGGRASKPVVDRRPSAIVKPPAPVTERVVERVVEPALASGSAPAPTPPPLPPTPPPPPVALHAKIAGLEVQGLPAAVVQRAVERALPAMHACAGTQPQVIEAHFSIGESRKAVGTRANGGSAAACVIAAISNIRTEVAPDVGDAMVSLKLGFVETR
jgi:serine/threonine-protein kinase